MSKQPTPPSRMSESLRVLSYTRTIIVIKRIFERDLTDWINFFALLSSHVDSEAQSDDISAGRAPGSYRPATGHTSPPTTRSSSQGADGFTVVRLANDGRSGHQHNSSCLTEPAGVGGFHATVNRPGYVDSRVRRARAFTPGRRASPGRRLPAPRRQCRVPPARSAGRCRLRQRCAAAWSPAWSR